MLTSGDVVDLDLGIPVAREAGFRHPAVVVTGQDILTQEPTIVHIVPLTSTNRGFKSEIEVEPDRHNGVENPCVAQAQQVRAISITRISQVRGNVGSVTLARIRDKLGLILDIRQ